MNDQISKILKFPQKIIHASADQWGAGRQRLRNWRLRKTQIGYVLIRLDGSFPERDAPPRSFIEKRLPLPPPEMSMQTFQRLVEAIAEADNVRGVVFNLDGVSAALARYQTLREAFKQLRRAGKTVVAYATMFDNGRYYLASAADQIICPPSAIFNVLGFYQEVTFLRDALKFVGIELANIQISPYKTALNTLSEQEMSPEMRDQLTWLLEDRYDQFISGIAAGRGMEEATIRKIIDEGPYTAAEAQTQGLIDNVAYEDELEKLLLDDKAAAADESDLLKLKSWNEVRKKLRGVYKRPLRGKKVAVISLEGMIISGQSQKPPVDLPIPFIGGTLAGDQTITKLFRQIEQDEDIAAVVFYVDSRGGSALASDIMAREVERLAKKMPVVAYMGDVAASGGYYVSALAQEIVCQPGTITGSIGVVMARPVLDDLYANLKMNPVSMQRGDRADLYTAAPLTDEMRQILFEGVVKTYDQFKDIVARGRDLPREELDPICEGRVWTGRQALNHKLVDHHGSFDDALTRALALADVQVAPDQQIEIENIYPEKGGQPLPLAFDQPQEMWPWIESRLKFFRENLYLLPIDLK
ncbi:MAG: signal peptide peptidase SppA [Ardenticatenaceae bacterium]|nr:signal peptide peptidase SppA [Ardenticatenaceae bacterium]